MINDLPASIHTKCKIFADDTKIYASTSQSHVLQNDLHSIISWCDEWQMNLNVSKCKVLHIGRSNPFNRYFEDSTKSNALHTIDSEKDLGVHFDQMLNFDVHICACIKKANRLIGIVYRSFKHLDMSSFVALYKTIIRTGLEYGNCIWNPIFKRQSVLIENVQRRATKLLPSISHLSYADRLKFLQLPSLKYRRLRGDLIQLYKIVHNQYNVDANEFYTFSQITSTRGARLKIYVEGCNSNIRHNSFIFRTVHYWNKLNDDTKICNTINAFKNAIDKDGRI